MIDALLATLERNAEVEIARVLEEGRAAAAAVTEAAAQRLAERRQQALGAREAEGRAALARTLAAARRAARERVLTARHELLERLFAALRKCLPQVTAAPEYRAALGTGVRRTLTFAGGQPVVIRCAPRLVPSLRQAIRSNGKLRVEADPGIAAGYRVATTGGGLEIDATLEGWMERSRDRLAQAGLAALEKAE